ncbi:hypothetical protein ABE099_01470 [Paenibacillus turicensis]|uniref:hypothetical protein n=1 Tax=Paenibacillus turicensis TaxID=160487 RepID=UPI003D29C600
MAIIKKIDVQIDLTQPAEELINVISIVLGYFPQQSEQILLFLDQSVGEALLALQRDEESNVKTLNDESSQ